MVVKKKVDVVVMVVMLVVMTVSASPLAFPESQDEQDLTGQVLTKEQKDINSEQPTEAEATHTSINQYFGNSSDDLSVMARHVVDALLHGNNSQMNEVITQLKTLNAAFRENLAISSCPAPFFMLAGQCYSLILEDVTWEAARQQCLQLGADLAQPQDLDQLRLYITNRYPRKNRRNFWLGGVSREKVWQWLSGDAINPRYWYTNEPSGNGECLAMFDGWDNPLTDFPCENDRRAVCEKALPK